jgi:hypothetical protein
MAKWRKLGVIMAAAIVANVSENGVMKENQLKMA